MSISPIVPRPLVPGYPIDTRHVVQLTPAGNDGFAVLLADEAEVVNSASTTKCSCTGACRTSRCPCKKASKLCTEACEKCVRKCKNRNMPTEPTAIEKPMHSAAQIPAAETTPHTCSEVESILEGSSPERCREILRMVFAENPEMVKGLSRPESEGERQPTQSPSFCKCRKCREMPSLRERKCCGQRLCITLQRACRTVTVDTEVVKTAINSNSDILVSTPHHDNRSMRHAAYRQYIMWRHGHLGRGNRIVVPSCVVWLIRDKYPSPDGVYAGFKLF